MFKEDRLEKQLKASQFNEYLGNFNGKWVIYNNLSGGLIEVGTDMQDLFTKGNFTTLSEGSVEALKQGRFIVDADLDEAQELRDTKDKWDQESTFIGLQIVPTLACNFACPYCYENEWTNTHRMTKETMDQVIANLENNIKPTTEALTVSWYGGEPLLAVKEIEYLTKGFKKLLKKHKISYQASMVSNGYLLNKKNVNTLVKCDVRSVQVTIDGPRDIHNTRRILSNGDGTFQKIVDNLKYALKRGMHVTVRINIDKTNVDSIEDLFNELKEEGIFDKVTISFGAVTSFGNACKSIEDTILTLDEAEKILSGDAIKSKLDETRKGYDRVPPNYIGCVAVSKNSLIVGPKGELYKCSKTVGTEKETCGNISKPDLSHPNYQKWLNVNSFESPSCGKCSILPICKGKGCAFDHLVHGENIFDCDGKKFQKDYAERIRELYKKQTA